MEHTIMASYVALLIGHLVMENGGHQKKIRTFLRVDAGFGFMAQILEKYYNFLNLTASVSYIVFYFRICEIIGNTTFHFVFTV